MSERLISSMRVRCHLSGKIERAVQSAMPAPPLAAAMSNQSIAGTARFLAEGAAQVPVRSKGGLSAGCCPPWGFAK